ncbi:hypothetical protein BDQ17DRAFT_1363686 [Cyathus striatus]|nr:hypothetical protein BDQ17DRAFT_1363686 [Cyathus striatus]
MAADNASQTSLPSSSSHRLLVPHSPTSPPILTMSNSGSTMQMPIPAIPNRNNFMNMGGGSGGSNRNSFISALNSGPPSPVPGSRPLSAAPSTVSLTAHYLPNKFSSSMLAPQNLRKRKPKVEVAIPKMGGGVEAFKNGEARMPGQGDVDYDGWEAKSVGGKRWNKFKWALFIANSCMSAYALTTLILLLLTYFNVFERAAIIRVGNHLELVLSTIACALALFTSTIGWAGILLNNRTFLGIYTFLLWIVFGKINAQWSRSLGAAGRLSIQNQLFCCGYFSPYVEATVSQTCYARSVLTGCKAPYLDFERDLLRRWYTWAFSILAVQAGIMITALLSANHVTYRFGKGMMPKAYRLSMDSMAVIMDNYASQLAETYGLELAEGVRSSVAAASSHVNINVQLPTLGYKDSGHRDGGLSISTVGGEEYKDGYKYESVGRVSPTSPMEK